MAILDSLATFSGSISGGAMSGQTVTGTNTTVLGSNSYDTTGGSPSGQNVDLAKGEDLDIAIWITTGFSGGTSVEFQYISADDAALSSNVTVLQSTGAIPIASLGAGKKVELEMGKADPRAVRRYIGVQYVLVGAVTAGAVVAAMQADGTPDLPQVNYASGFSVL